MNPAKIISMLERSPEVLENLLAGSTPKRLKAHLIPGKWCAHEHAVHFSKVEKLIHKRLDRMLAEKHPVFEPYVPGATTPKDELITTSLGRGLKEFKADRKRLVARLKKLKPAMWKKTGTHAVFDDYSIFSLARHLLLHDFTHMYRIEDLLLNKTLRKKK